MTRLAGARREHRRRGPRALVLRRRTSVTARRWSWTRPGSPTVNARPQPSGAGGSRGPPTPTRTPTTSPAAPSWRPTARRSSLPPAPASRSPHRPVDAGEDVELADGVDAAGDRHAGPHARSPRLPAARRWRRAGGAVLRRLADGRRRRPDRPARRRAPRGAGPRRCSGRCAPRSSRCPTTCPSIRPTAPGRSARPRRASARTTTIGRERATNPLLADRRRGRVRRARSSSGLGSFPRYFRELPEINRRGPRLYPARPRPRPARPRHRAATISPTVPCSSTPARSTRYAPGAPGRGDLDRAPTGVRQLARLARRPRPARRVRPRRRPRPRRPRPPMPHRRPRHDPRRARRRHRRLGRRRASRSTSIPLVAARARWPTRSRCPPAHRVGGRAPARTRSTSSSATLTTRDAAGRADHASCAATASGR